MYKKKTQDTFYHSTIFSESWTQFTKMYAGVNIVVLGFSSKPLQKRRHFLWTNPLRYVLLMLPFWGKLYKNSSWHLRVVCQVTTYSRLKCVHHTSLSNNSIMYPEIFEKWDYFLRGTCQLNFELTFLCNYKFFKILIKYY